MKLFTKSQLTKLLQNGSPENRGKNHKPVVKLFTPDAQCTWLISEIEPENPDIAFGLCDLGMGYPELGCVSIAELEALRGKLGLPLERDLSFEGKFPITVYARAASHKEYITDDISLLQQYANKIKES